MCVRFSSLLSLLVPNSCSYLFFSFDDMFSWFGSHIGAVCSRFKMGPSASVVGAGGREDK